ncbi:MAG TPA: DUF1501 domain-containing protein [Verrucomicrobiae bacterium]|jgi:hypothetical protein
MNPNEHLTLSRESLAHWTRRDFLARTGMGFGAMSAAGLLGPQALAAAGATSPLSPKQPHMPAKAKHVIHIFAQGAPTHVDTWDPKPELSKYDDKPLPGLNGVGFGSPFKFNRSGKSGIEVSEVFPQLAKHIDEMAVIRSMYTDIPSHEVATVFMNTGSLRLAKPSLGSWAVYGLGSDNQNMPGYISLRPGGLPPGGTQNWQSAFLPGVYQGTTVNTQGRPDEIIENIRNQFTPLSEQRRQLDLVNKLNTIHSQTLQKDAQLEARLEAYEMAFKMQTEATDAFDIAKETQATRDLYGNTPQGKQLLIARRLVEKGVRFVQVWDGGWDHHQNLETALSNKAQGIDGPAAALLTDLKQRGLLDQTLVIWGGEFGRTVTRDRNGGGEPGRDHNNRAFSLWMAGGGVRGGIVYGSTDEFGARAVVDKVHIHDIHATILALLGFDHTKLTYRYNGRDFRLTDNFGVVVKNVIA